MKRIVVLLAVSSIAVMLIGCKPEEEIQNVPTPKPQSAEIVVNHELEAPEHTVNVSGHGEVIATPDFATITVGVHATADTAENASAQCETNMQKVYDTAMSFGVAKVDASMTGIDITAQLREADGAVTGYVASETITVVVRNVKIASTVMSTIIDAGASEISGITYSLVDASSAYQQALAKAMEDAKAKADAVAIAAGVKLGDVASVVETPYNDSKLMGVTFESSQIIVSADVSVSYLIP